MTCTICYNCKLVASHKRNVIVQKTLKKSIVQKMMYSTVLYLTFCNTTFYSPVAYIFLWHTPKQFHLYIKTDQPNTVTVPSKSLIVSLKTFKWIQTTSSARNSIWSAGNLLIKKENSCCSWVKKQKIVYQTVFSIADKFTNGYCRELSGLDSTHVRDLPAAK